MTPGTTTRLPFRNICNGKSGGALPDGRQRIGRSDPPDRTDMPLAAPLSMIIRPLPPFRLDLTVWALRRRERNAIDRWDGATYRRVVVIGGRLTEIAVRQAGSSAAPQLIVTATPPPRTPPGRQRVRAVVDCSVHVSISHNGTDWPDGTGGYGSLLNNSAV
jgi:hypothetical protein